VQCSRKSPRKARSLNAVKTGQFSEDIGDSVGKMDLSPRTLIDGQSLVRPGKRKCCTLLAFQTSVPCLTPTNVLGAMLMLKPPLKPTLHSHAAVSFEMTLRRVEMELLLRTRNSEALLIVGQDPSPPFRARIFGSQSTKHPWHRVPQAPTF
jgi:hypothetical protein